MKTIAKKILSVLLCVSLIFGVAVIGSSGASEDKNTGTDIPVIYLEGAGYPLAVENEDGTTRRIYPIELSGEEITALVEENIDVFAEAFFTQQWGEFCDVLYEIMSDMFKEVALDENGEAPNGSRCEWTWSPETLTDKKNAYGKYDLQAYTLLYDFRMDPYKTATELHSYIEAVMAVTGATEVALMGRCLGANITAAYMDKYNAEYISDYIVYCGAHCGAAVCSKAFAGELNLEADGIERFIYEMNLLGNDLYDDLLDAFITVLNDTYGLDVVCWAVNNVYKDIYLDIVPRILRDTFATFPGYWSMVSPEDYERAKEVVFHGADKEKYANFISIIDNYHNNVAKEINEDFLRYTEMGVDVFNLTKYGYQAIPISGEKENNTLSDRFCHVRHASNGATALPIGQTFDDAYIASAKTMGTYKYISPDRQIDASTALLPDRTWFVKNFAHTHFPQTVNGIFCSMINNDGFDIYSDPDFPQYLVFNDETQMLEPMVEENMNTERWEATLLEAITEIFRIFGELIKQAFASA